MAQELDDGEFWLPSEFLTDDDLLTDFKTDRFSGNRNNGFLSKFGFNSGLSSPVESVIGSTETESEEDDSITVLTRKIADSTLHNSSFYSDYRTTKGQRLSSSPQSTLCGFKHGSSRGSPNCASQVSSPPDAKYAENLNFLYAAAEEVTRMRMVEETTSLYSNKLYGATLSDPHKNPNLASGFYPNQPQARFSHQQLQATQFQQMKKQQEMTSGVWAQENIGYQFQNGRINGGGAPGLLVPSWPTLQQSQQTQQPRRLPGTGARAVFLGETGARKERTGTGVFLPRRFETNPNDARKKPGCSVVLPEKVVHALNLDSIDSSSQLGENRNFTAEYGANLRHRNNIKMMMMMMKNLRPAQPQAGVKQEVGLPHEWAY